METLLTDKQLQFKKYIKDFLQKELAPHVDEIEESHDFPMQFFHKLAKHRLLAMNFPRYFGGQESDSITCALFIEEIAKISSGVAGAVTTAGMTGPFLILATGNEKQKEKYLHGVATAQTITAFGATEPNAGSDLNNIETIAVKEGAHYRINGTKTFCTHSTVANIFLIVTNTNPEGPQKEYTVFLLERGRKGLTVGEKFHKMGWTCNDTAEVYLNDVIATEDDIVGQRGAGFNAAFSSINFTRIILSAIAYGVSQSTLESAIDYSRHCMVGGKPLISEQGIRCDFANLATEIEAAGMLIYRAAYLQDKGLRNRKEAAMSKYYSTNLAKKVTKECLRIMGLEAFRRRHRTAVNFTDAPVFTIADGTSEIQLENIAKGLNLLKSGHIGK